MHPGADSRCLRMVIDAHSISRAAALASLADRGGHVLSFHPIPVSVDERHPPLVPKRVGLRVASTFTGMCRRHDAEFRDVDITPLVPTSRQCAQLAFRSVALEVHKKLAHVSFVRDAGASVAARPEARGLADLDAFVEAFGGALLGLGDMRALKRAADAAITGNAGALHFEVLRVNGQPSLAAAGVFTPDFDLAGARLQDLSDSRMACDLIALAVVPAEDHTDVVLAWEAGAKAPTRWFESLVSRPSPEIVQLVPQIALGYVENVYFSAAWWAGLSDDAKTALANLVRFVSSAPLPLVDESLVPWEMEGFLAIEG